MAFRDRVVRDSVSAALQRAYLETKSRPFPVDQIINAKDALNPLLGDELAAQAVRDGFSPLLSGQDIPSIYEPREVENADGTFGAGI